MLRYTTPRSQVLERNFRRCRCTGAVAGILTILVCLCVGIFDFGASNSPVHHRALANGAVFQVGDLVKINAPSGEDSDCHKRNGTVVKDEGKYHWTVDWCISEDRRQYQVRCDIRTPRTVFEGGITYITSKTARRYITVAGAQLKLVRTDPRDRRSNEIVKKTGSNWFEN